MGVLSVPLQLPTLLPLSSFCRTHGAPTHPHATFNLCGVHRRTARAARARTHLISVRADASPSDLAITAAAVYGGLLLGGGFYAYFKTSSTGSLLGGVSGSLLMVLVFYLLLNPDSKDSGEAIGFGTALLFAAVFGIRLVATKKFIPAGPLLLLSMVTSAVFVGAYLQDRV